MLLAFLPLLALPFWLWALIGGVAGAIIGGVIVYTISRLITRNIIRQILGQYKSELECDRLTGRIKRMYQDGEYEAVDVGLTTSNGDTETIRIRSEDGIDSSVYSGMTISC